MVELDALLPKRKILHLRWLALWIPSWCVLLLGLEFINAFGVRFTFGKVYMGAWPALETVFRPMRC